MQQQYEERLATQRAGQASSGSFIAGGKPRSFWPPRFSNCIVVDQLVDTSSGTTKPAPYVVQHLHMPSLHHPPVPSHHPHPSQQRLHLLLSTVQQKSLPIPSAIEVSIHQNGRGGSPNAFDNTTVVLAADLHHVLGEALSNPLQLLFPHPSSTQLISKVPPLQQFQTNVAASPSSPSVDSTTSTTNETPQHHASNTTEMTQAMPMVFWAAQTQAALQSVTMGKYNPTLSRYVPPTQAANVIHRWFRRIDQRILRRQLAPHIHRRRGEPFFIRRTAIPGQYQYRLCKSWDVT